MLKVDQLYTDAMAKILAIVVSKFQKDNEAGILFVSRSGVARQLLKELYDMSVSKNEIQPIEDLPKEEKQKLFDQCKTFDDPTQMCRLLHALKAV